MGVESGIDRFPLTVSGVASKRETISAWRPSRERNGPRSREERDRTTVLKLGIFVALSALLALTLRGQHTHRVYRYFAFVTVAGLVVLNADAWFRAPLAPRQLVSWVLLAASALFAEEGFRLLRGSGAPEGGFEDTTRLVTSGVYRYVRHPMYASIVLGAAGALLKRPSFLALALALVVVAFSFATARVEEHANVEKFGEAYRDYQERTKLFIPFLV